MSVAVTILERMMDLIDTDRYLALAQSPGYHEKVCPT